MPPLQEPPRALEFLFSEANGYRSREKVVIKGDALGPPPVATRVPLLPGTLLYPEMDYTPVPPVPTGYHLPVSALGFNLGAGTAADPGAQATRVNAILMYPADARSGDVEAAAIVRDAEVNDAYLIYALATTVGTAFTQDEIDAVAAALLQNNVIVRLGVLAEGLAVPPIEPPAPRPPLP
jgi:hypothetical protein